MASSVTSQKRAKSKLVSYFILQNFVGLYIMFHLQEMKGIIGLCCQRMDPTHGPFQVKAHAIDTKNATLDWMISSLRHG